MGTMSPLFYLRLHCFEDKGKKAISIIGRYKNTKAKDDLKCISHPQHTKAFFFFKDKTKAIMVMVYNSFSFYLISFVQLWVFFSCMIQLTIPLCSYIQTDSIECFCLYMVSILFWSAYESSTLIKKINHSDGSSCSTKSDYPLPLPTPSQTIHLHSAWWQSMEKTHRVVKRVCTQLSSNRLLTLEII